MLNESDSLSELCGQECVSFTRNSKVVAHMLQIWRNDAFCCFTEPLEAIDVRFLCNIVRVSKSFSNDELPTLFSNTQL